MNECDRVTVEGQQPADNHSASYSDMTEKLKEPPNDRSFHFLVLLFQNFQ